MVRMGAWTVVAVVAVALVVGWYAGQLLGED